MHHAPGEAEAECALLQREGIVDGVLSEDVDTLMFGSGLTLRQWTSEGKPGKTPTHVNVHDATKTKENSGLDREGMVLIAMMSGGDYIPEGIPGCGPKLACQAARAGFGSELCKLRKSDKEGLREWKERLSHEIHTNESKLFKQKKPSLVMPDDFPNLDVLGYYTHPAISGPEKLQRLKDTLKWDMPLDYASLREFAKDAFDWQCLGGAKKFIRNLAPAVLTRELRLRGEAADQTDDDLGAKEARESELVKAIHGKRNHASTDAELELRISFVPIKLVDIDLSIEEPDPEEELPADDDDDSDSEPPPSQAFAEEDGECPASPKKKRGPSTYDPTVPEKIWMLGNFVRLGVPLKVQDYEAMFNDPKKFAARNAPKTSKPRKKPAENNGGMKRGALNKFAVSTKPGVDREQGRKKSTNIDEVDLSEVQEAEKVSNKPKPAHVAKAKKPTTQQPSISNFGKVTKAGVGRPSKEKATEIDELDLSGIDALAKEQSRNTLQAANKFFMPTSRAVVVEEVDLSEPISRPAMPPRRATKRRSPEPGSPFSMSRTRSPPRKVMRQPEVIDLLSSSPVKPLPSKKSSTPPREPPLRHTFVRDTDISQSEMLEIPLPDTVTRRRRKSPFKRHQTAPAAGEDVEMENYGFSSMPHPMSPAHGTVEAMDLASPLPNALCSPESESSLPSPSMFRTQMNRPVVVEEERTRPAVTISKDKAMTAAEIRPAGQKQKSLGDIHEWLRRSQSITPGKARYVDRLAEKGPKQPVIVEEDAIISIESSMPTPPMEEIELDEADVIFARKASATPNRHHDVVAVERAEVSVGALLPSARYLRDRAVNPNPSFEKPATKAKAAKPTRFSRAESAYSAAPGPAPQPEQISEKGRKEKSKWKKTYIQPRESLPGAWKFVEEVDLSEEPLPGGYRKAFRKSEVEMVDLTGD